MFEYLLLNNHLESAKAFRQVSNVSWKQQLLLHFNKGHQQNFFRLFQLLKKEQKLQFYLRVYFLIYSIHPNLNQNHKTSHIPQKQINLFKQYLDTKGAQLAKTSEFLQFYALPFVKNPLQHTTFKTLFTRTWISNLKEKLVTFMQIQQESMKLKVKSYYNQFKTQINTSNNKQNKQLQQQILNKLQSKQSKHQQKLQSKYEDKIKKLQKTNQQLFHELDQINIKYKNLEENHQSMIQSFNSYMIQSQSKWFENTKQLVSTAKTFIDIINNTNISNANLQRKFIKAKKRIQKYQRFVNKKFDDLMSVSQDISIFDKPSMNQISSYTIKSAFTSKSWIPTEKNINNITNYAQIDEYIPSNFIKINSEFDKLPQSQKQLIISGFSWRIIKAKTKQIRRSYSISFIKYNFLGLGKCMKNKQTNQDQLQVVRYLRQKQTRSIVLNLLNNLKFDFYARRHLFQSNNLTVQLLHIMQSSIIENDMQIFQQIIDIFSAISLYKVYRQKMIQMQLPLYLLDVLQQNPHLFQDIQIMQSLMICLINFAATQSGLTLLEENPNVYTILSQAFYTQSSDLKMLVSGMYYTLLGRKSLYDVAIQANLPQFISYLLTSADQQTNYRQLKFLQEKLKNFSQADQTSEEISDNQSQSEIQQLSEEQIQNLQTLIKGHQYIINKYSLKQKQAEQQDNSIRKIKEQFQKETKDKDKVQQKVKQKQKGKAKSNKQQNNSNKFFENNISIQNFQSPQRKYEQPKIKLQNISEKQPIKQKNQQNNPKNNQNSFRIVKSHVKTQDLHSNRQKTQISQKIPKNDNINRNMNKVKPQQQKILIASPSHLHATPTLPALRSPLTNQNTESKKKSQSVLLRKGKGKQILKQINQQIKQKKNTVHHNNYIEKPIEQKRKSKSYAINQQKNIEMYKKEILNARENNSSRNNLHINYIEPNGKNKQQQEQQLIAFKPKPKINRTPPKQQDF